MGYFTTAQAAAAGVSPMALVMMAKRGTLERPTTGVYRLADFPVHPLSQYMQASLWPYRRPGVLSHETALSLYGLSDVSPAKVHITVPADFRIQRQVPGYMAIHHGELLDEDVTRLEGMPITTPARTIRDCISVSIGPALIRQAIDEGRRGGRLSGLAAADLEHALGAAGGCGLAVGQDGGDERGRRRTR